MTLPFDPSILSICRNDHQGNNKITSYVSMYLFDDCISAPLTYYTTTAMVRLFDDSRMSLSWMENHQGSAPNRDEQNWYPLYVREIHTKPTRSTAFGTDTIMPHCRIYRRTMGMPKLPMGSSRRNLDGSPCCWTPTGTRSCRRYPRN